ncbi:hypothetical protein [Trichormus variabilis]|uniref:hypothetical protein n=1 Tax=Anabaena variabilis TaxID=264691 RepID=UPI00000CEF51|nr:hypothetical protein [Trichormus variabilis]MBD2382751.1 hypothetical protein [Trichormus variabilis FACHB-319]QHD83392.1 hypothetical protein GSQ19_26450 [Trichormus variabilis 0441]BAB78335.1 asl7251 [Nostoc sp. PCC 7120 = FACHB-418]
MSNHTPVTTFAPQVGVILGLKCADFTYSVGVAITPRAIAWEQFDLIPTSAR